MKAYMNADYAGSSVTRRSCTWFLIYLNLALIYLHSKKHRLVETSTFGSKCIAMKYYTGPIRGLQIKL